MYTYQQNKVGTWPVSVRIRKDVLSYLTWEQVNKSELINALLYEAVKRHQREGRWTTEITR